MTMAHHDIVTPVTEAQVRSLRIGDTVTLNGILFGIRDRDADRRCSIAGRTTRFDLRGHALIHTAPNVRKVEADRAFPAGYAPMCIGTTTSARMEAVHASADAAVRRAHHHRQGRPARGLAAPRFAELGGAYLAIIGGTAALETTWVEAIEDVDLDDLNPSRCGSSACRASGRCSWRWTATAAALREVATAASRVAPRCSRRWA
jgi:L(+)-tartrate dehydratase beta subunit